MAARFLPSVSGKGNDRRALLCYIVEPFEDGPDDFHQNRRQALAMAGILADLGYEVDAASYLEKDAIAFERPYDLVLDLHPDSAGFWRKVAKAGTLRIGYGTESEPGFNNAADLGRLEMLKERRGVELAPRRLTRPFDRETMESLDLWLLMGNERTLSTYAQTRLDHVALLPNTGFPGLVASGTGPRNSRRFAFVGSGGQVHRGLDWALEFFAKRPGLELFVFSPFAREPDFCRAFGRELSRTPNIHPVGFADIRSPAFLDVVKTCRFLLYPSCSEGMSGSVLTGMSCGLLPVISPECGFPGDEALLLEGNSPEAMSRAVEVALSLDDARIDNMVSQNFQLLESKYSMGAFEAAFRKALLELHERKGISRPSSGRSPRKDGVGKPPLVSAIVSTYASENLLEGCLRDLAGQTLFDRGELEIVVVDSASPEREGEIVRRFQEIHGDRIRYIRTSERETLYAAWNRGIRASRGRYVTNANTDDAHRRDALELLAASLEAHPDADLAFADCYWTDKANDVWEDRDASRRLVSYPDYHPATSLLWCTLGPHPLWRRNLFERIGHFDPAYRAAGDLEFQTRFALCGARAVHIPQPLSLFYQNRRGLTQGDSTSDREADEIFLRWRRMAPISRLYRVDPNDPEAVAAGWIAMGHASLRYKLPWGSDCAVPDLALDCFCRALEAAPENIHARACIHEIRAALGKDSVLPAHAAPPRVSETVRPPEPPAAVEPIRWEPPSAKETVGPEVHWISPIWDPSGYGTLGRSFLGHLSTTDFGLSARSWGRHSVAFRQASSPEAKSLFDGLLARAPAAKSVVVESIPVSALGRLPQAGGHHVGFTMFETDSLPSGWISRCDSMDEIWVPSSFNVATFRRAGVQAPILTMPLGVDTSRFLPGLEPLAIDGPQRATTFLSVFEWTHRKGWDVLLRAWATRFGPDDDVRLVLRAYPANAIEDDPASWVESRINAFLATLGKSRRDCAPIVVLGRQVPDEDMPRLYAAADVFVAPSRGEGWGLPHMEAMSCGVPAIATRWSGNLDFQDDDNSWLIDVDGLVEIDGREEFEFYRGQKWAEPSASHLAELMARAAGSPELRADKGRRARADMESRWDWSAVAERAQTRLREIAAGIPASRSVLARKEAKTGESPSVRWVGQVFNFSGYARLARETLAGLEAAGVRATCDPQLNDPEYFLSLKDQPRRIERWKDLLSRPAEPGTLVVCDIPRDTRGTDVVEALSRANPGCTRKVCWTMFETDRLPAGWAEVLNRLDEVWVPSEFNRITFSEGGVDPDRIHVIPGCIDTTPYASAHPAELPGFGYAFLSVFQWIRRKGWDVLIDAWAKAFGPDDDVRLVLRCHPFGKGAPVSEQLRAHLAARGLRREDLAPIHLIQDFVPDSRMPSLYSACDCFVLPTRGEGWGLPFLEAMAAGKPVIGTRWSAPAEFLSEDNAWLLDPRAPVEVSAEACAEVSFFESGHRWADPDPEELARLLRQAFEHPEEGRTKGRNGLAEARNWSPKRTAEAIVRRLDGLAEGKIPSIPGNRIAPPRVLTSVAGGKLSSALRKVASGLLSRPVHAKGPQSAKPALVDPGASPSVRPVLSVRWEGSQFVHHSLAHVNREICLRLAKAGHDLSLVPWETDQFGPGDDPDLKILETLKNAPLEGPCQVHVRHQWPPVLQAPAQGRWVVVQPWEFGSPPKEWIPAFRDQVDEIWAYTHYVKRVYVEAGIPEGKIRVVPLGVDANRFRPGLEPLPGLERDGRLTFLYVGGTIARKGFDVLLNAWRAAFSASDPVRLVVKDMGGESFYKGQTGESMVRELNASGTSAPVVYSNRDLSLTDLPRIYASGDVLVHPYRGEGFGLPVAEAMASGLAVVVTRGGAADDFCGEEESWGIPSRRVPVPGGRVGPFETVAEPWWLEPSVEDLSAILREAASNAPARERKGEAGRKRILSGWTWDHCARAVESALVELSARPSKGIEPVAPPNLDELNKLLLRVEAVVARGEIAQAAPLTNQAVESFPDQPMAWLARSMVLRGLEKFAQASDAVARSLDLRESPEALLESVQIHRLTGQTARAKIAERRLSENHSDWVRATRQFYQSKGQAWPLDPQRKTSSHAKKSIAPPQRKRR